MLLGCLKVIACFIHCFPDDNTESVFLTSQIVTNYTIATRQFARCENHNGYVETQMRLNDRNSKAKGESVGNVLSVIENTSFF